MRAVPLLLLLAACGSAPPAARPAAEPCRFDAPWVQQTLDLWEVSTGEILGLPPSALPYMVYFDRQCAYAIAAPSEPWPMARELPPLRFRGAPIRVWAAEHDGRVRLPNGNAVTVGMYAAASVYRAPAPTPFYAMALPSVWRAELPVDRQDAFLDDEFATIAQHELTHTLQLHGIYALAEQLSQQAGKALVLDDDQIQRAFEPDAAYVAAYEEERGLLFGASLVSGAEQERMVRRAVELARARQARWFVGEHAIDAQLDGRYLAMEGLGEWVRYKHLTRGPVGKLPRQTRDQVLARLRGRKPYWSQDEGLAALLVLEQRMPAFRERLLGAELPDAFTLLAETVR